MQKCVAIWECRKCRKLDCITIQLEMPANGAGSGLCDQPLTLASNSSVPKWELAHLHRHDLNLTHNRRRDTLSCICEALNRCIRRKALLACEANGCSIRRLLQPVRLQLQLKGVAASKREVEGGWSRSYRSCARWVQVVAALRNELGPGCLLVYGVGCSSRYQFEGDWCRFH